MSLRRVLWMQWATRRCSVSVGSAVKPAARSSRRRVHESGGSLKDRAAKYSAGCRGARCMKRWNGRRRHCVNTGVASPCLPCARLSPLLLMPATSRRKNPLLEALGAECASRWCLQQSRAVPHQAGRLAAELPNAVGNQFDNTAIAARPWNPGPEIWAQTKAALTRSSRQRYGRHACGHLRVLNQSAPRYAPCSPIRRSALYEFVCKVK